MPHTVLQCPAHIACRARIKAAKLPTCPMPECPLCMLCHVMMSVMKTFLPALGAYKSTLGVPPCLFWHSLHHLLPCPPHTPYWTTPQHILCPPLLDLDHTMHVIMPPHCVSTMPTYHCYVQHHLTQQHSAAKFAAGQPLMPVTHL